MKKFKRNLHFKNPDLEIIQEFFNLFKNLKNLTPLEIEENLEILYKKYTISPNNIEIIKIFFDSEVNQGIQIIFEGDTSKILTEYYNKFDPLYTGSYSVQELFIIFITNPFGLHNLLFKDILNILKYVHNILYLKIIIVNLFTKAVMDTIEKTFNQNQKFHLRMPTDDKAIMINCKVVAAMFQQYNRHLNQMGFRASLVNSNLKKQG